MKYISLSMVMAVAMVTSLTANAQEISLHAAGSLRPPLSEISKAFEAKHGATVKQTYGASGLLRDRIANGEPAQVFASANMEHPLSLHAAGKASPVVMFAQNRMCALARAGLAVSTATIIDTMLNANVRLATSTPKADPSGDYAWAIFRKIDAQKPGSLALLEKKALQLVGGPNSPPPPTDRVVYGALLASGQADVFLAYCSLARVAVQENAGQTLIELPDSIAVGADYGLTVLNGAPEKAHQFALFILSDQGQHIMRKHGFKSVTLSGSQ